MELKKQNFFQGMDSEGHYFDTLALLMKDFYGKTLN